MNEDSKQEKRYNYFYRIDNLVNSKFYYGVHSTDDLDDGYMGSGIALKKAKKKYGIENFKKTILLYFNTEEEMFAYEREFITPEFLEIHRGICYNEKPGGDGGWLKHSPETIEKMKGRTPWNKDKKHSPESIEKMRAAHKGKKMSPEHIEKIRKSLKGKNKGKTHPAWNKGIPMSPEAKKKSSESHKGRYVSPETRKKQSEALKRYYLAKKAAQTQVA